MNEWRCNISMSDGISLLPLVVVDDSLFVGVSMSPDQSGCWRTGKKLHLDVGGQIIVWVG